MDNVGSGGLGGSAMFLFCSGSTYTVFTRSVLATERSAVTKIYTYTKQRFAIPYWLTCPVVSIGTARQGAA